MKKILFAIAATMLLSSVNAQDTIHATRPFENYYTFYWNNYELGDSLYCVISNYYPINYKGLIMLTYNPITVYGLAVGVTVEYPNKIYENYVYDSTIGAYIGKDPVGYYDHNGNYHLVGDSALDESYMDFTIMQVITNQIVEPVGDTLRLHLKYDSVSYYLDREFTDLFYAYWHPDPSCPILSVYEKYFSTPVTVKNKFYIGGINHSAETYPHSVTDFLYPRIAINGWDVPGSIVQTGNVIHWSSTDEWEEHAEGSFWEWFFPILTPDPNGDTTGFIPDDTTQTSIQPASWERFVSLQPNPATDEATVLSSFGMTQVELFDMAGNSVLVQDATGLSAKLNVATLPRGTYIVRITTPMGVTSRKLILK